MDENLFGYIEGLSSVTDEFSSNIDGSKIADQITRSTKSMIDENEAWNRRSAELALTKIIGN